MIGRMVSLLGVFFVGTPLLALTPRYEGIWVIVESPDDGLNVSFPQTGVVGASLLFSPESTDLVTAQASARIEVGGKGFSGAHFWVTAQLPGASVQMKCLADGEMVELVVGLGEFSVPISIDRPLSALQFDFAAESAPPERWYVQIEGLVFDRQGWQIAYSPDSAGLDVWIDAPDRVRFGIDPDWAELGWPLSGSVSALLRPVGGISSLALTYRQTLPPGAFLARVGIDGEPIQLFESGPFPPEAIDLPNVDGEQLELSLIALQKIPGDGLWNGVFENVVAQQVDPSDTFEPEPDADAVDDTFDATAGESLDAVDGTDADRGSGCHGTGVQSASWWLFCFGWMVSYSARWAKRRRR